jgi:hypothetical protein
MRGRRRPSYVPRRSTRGVRRACADSRWQQRGARALPVSSLPRACCVARPSSRAPPPSSRESQGDPTKPARGRARVSLDAPRELAPYPSSPPPKSTFSLSATPESRCKSPSNCGPRLAVLACPLPVDRDAVSRALSGSCRVGCSTEKTIFDARGLNRALRFLSSLSRKAPLLRTFWFAPRGPLRQRG